MPWCDVGEPPEGYMVQIGPASEMKRVSDCEGDRVSHLLLWVYNHFVHFVPGKDAVAHEELIYLVDEVSMSHEPEWSATVKCFSVWDQETLTITFKLESTRGADHFETAN